MNDPHVESLKYKLITGADLSYRSPPPVSFADPVCNMILQNDVLVCRMSQHHATVSGAMDAVRPVIRAWEIQSALDYGRGAMRFEFDSADVIDRAPVSAPPTTHTLSASTRLHLTGSASCTLVKASYPEPPATFKATQLLELLFNRYHQYLDGKDLLTTMGYACLSAIQDSAGGRTSASTTYSIARDVLDKLGELTSDVGDELTARKFDQHSTRRAHTDAEINWVLEAVKLLIRRVGKYEHSPQMPLQQITLSQLPRI